VSTTDRDTSRAFVAAVIGAGTMIAFQTAGKATRDALFLSSYDVSLLPRTVMAAAVVSVVAALLASRWMTLLSPARLVPLAFGVSAVLLLLEWMLLEQFRGVVAIAVYLHLAALGAVLISGFWSVVNERFDPRTAKRYVGRIAAGGTVGGLVGGLIAERISTFGEIAPMFPVLAALHVICAALVLLVRDRESRQAKADAEPGMFSGVGVIAQTTYLRMLVTLVLLVGVAEVLIDYVLKARASDAFPEDAALLRFFALFYTSVGLLTVIIQAAASRAALQRLGLTRTVAILPAGVAVGGIGAIAVPGLVSAAVARGIESIVHHGLYRAGYELLFTPVTPSQKRAAKALVDVGVVRFGDILGSGLVQLALVVLAASALNALLGAAVVISVMGVVVALGLRRGYVRALEKSLLSRAIQLDLDEVEDAVTRSTVMQSSGTLGMTRVRPSVSAEQELAPARPEASLMPADPELQRIADLRSGDPARVQAALTHAPLTPTLAGHVIPLLAWDGVLRDAITALRAAAPSVTGQLIDHLVDRDEEFAVRRRIPIVLASCPTQRAVDGLLNALDDARFEVRYRCGRVLNRLWELNATLVIRRERIFEIVLREAAVDHGVWESHRLLDTMEDDQWSPVMDEVLRERSNRGLEHVFTLLSLVLERQPLKIAFRGLHTEDRQLRGTALEYLETALPEQIRKALWPFLEAPRGRQPPRRSAQEVLDELIQSSHSIVLDLERLRKLEGDSTD
jgi:hypothetical protein